MRRTILQHTPDGLKDRIVSLERKVSDLLRDPARPVQSERSAPLIFHWPGAVTDFVGARNGPGLLPSSGPVRRIEYRFDTGASVTVEWELDGVVVATHTIAADGSDATSFSYGGGNLVATVTADAGASGLTALVSLG